MLWLGIVFYRGKIIQGHFFSLLTKFWALGSFFPQGKTLKVNFKINWKLRQIFPPGEEKSLNGHPHRHFFPPSNFSPGGKKCLKSGSFFPRGKKVPRRFFPPGENSGGGKKRRLHRTSYRPCLIGLILINKQRNPHIIPGVTGDFPPSEFSPGGKIA